LVKGSILLILSVKLHFPYVPARGRSGDRRSWPGIVEKRGRKRDQKEESEIPNYRGLTLIFVMSEFYGVSQRNLAILAGAISDASHEFQQEVSKFAAQSESFAKLTRQEQQILDKFITCLKSEVKTSEGRQDSHGN